MNILQNAQTLQLFTINMRGEYYSQRLLKMMSWKVWVEGSRDLLKEGVERKHIK